MGRLCRRTFRGKRASVSVNNDHSTPEPICRFGYATPLQVEIDLPVYYSLTFSER